MSSRRSFADPSENGLLHILRDLRDEGPVAWILTAAALIGMVAFNVWLWK